jgi:hypothetical protein
VGIYNARLIFKFEEVFLESIAFREHDVKRMGAVTIPRIENLQASL